MAVDMYELLRKEAARTSEAAPLSYDAEVQKRLSEMAQRRAFGAGGATPAATVTSPVVPSVAAVPKPTGLAYRLGKWGGRIFAPLGLGAMGIGMADKAAEINASPESKGAIENTLNVLSGADITGFGGWLGRKLTGRPEPTVPTILPAPPGPVPGAPLEESGQFPAIPMTGVVPPVGATPPVAPFTAADVRGTRIPTPGTGAILNNRTGVVTNINAPMTPEDIAANEMRAQGRAVYGVDNREPAFGATAGGDAIAAIMNIKERTGKAVQAQAVNKMLMDYALKAPGASESAAKAQIHAATLEQARLAAERGATPAETSAILAGRAPVMPTFGESLTSMPDKAGTLTLIQRTGPGAGAVRKVVPTPAQRTLTRAQVVAQARANGETPEQGLARAKAQNITVID